MTGIQLRFEEIVEVKVETKKTALERSYTSKGNVIYMR
jgi:hypothetical protein